MISRKKMPVRQTKSKSIDWMFQEIRKTTHTQNVSLHPMSKQKQ